MMTTPIIDFVKEYSKNATRLHMPGHKGTGFIGIESGDITEVSGADSLFEANGIIAESEKNASRLFGCNSFYSAEGSSLCIRAMVFLAKNYGCKKIIAARNCHKSFISAAALTDTDIEWLYGEGDKSYLSCNIDLNALEAALASQTEKTALYITSPDYLGNMADIKAVSEICKKYGVLLMVDNAHGAYLKFLPTSMHPMDLGADICCDSAHKTLPVLTGGAYLHIAPHCPPFFTENARNALSLFASTSPSYLILQSLDYVNLYLYNGYKDKLSAYISLINTAKGKIASLGYELQKTEPLKIVITPKSFGYYGTDLARLLENRNIYCEFADKDNVVFMLTPENGEMDINTLLTALEDIKRLPPINQAPPPVPFCERALSVREAIFSQKETVSANAALGRILADFNIACPPAVPVAICGERISKEAVECFDYYQIKEISVVKNI